MSICNDVVLRAVEYDFHVGRMLIQGHDEDDRQGH